MSSSTRQFPDPPPIPGFRVPLDPEHELQGIVHNFLKMPGQVVRFPGSQPVSFKTGNIQQLEEEDFWVCEKTDGLRVLLLSVYSGNTGRTSFFLIDRNNAYYEVHGLYFPSPSNLAPHRLNGANLLDGELVMDVDQQGRNVLRYYAFDALLIWGENLMEKPLTSRYGRMQQELLGGLQKWRASTEGMAYRSATPFEIVCKPMQRSYGLKIVLEESVDPRKQRHKSDGLIFTRVNAKYKPGSCQDILKWKPASENSVDFLLNVHRVPGDEMGPPETIGSLKVWIKDDEHKPWGVLDGVEEQVEQWEAAGERYEGRIIEASFLGDNQWKFMRFRDDKEKANHISVAQSVKSSIVDDITEEMLIEKAPRQRETWKARETALRR